MLSNSVSHYKIMLFQSVIFDDRPEAGGGENFDAGALEAMNIFYRLSVKQKPFRKSVLH